MNIDFIVVLFLSELWELWLTFVALDLVDGRVLCHPDGLLQLHLSIKHTCHPVSLFDMNRCLSSSLTTLMRPRGLLSVSESCRSNECLQDKQEKQMSSRFLLCVHICSHVLQADRFSFRLRLHWFQLCTGIQEIAKSSLPQNRPSNVWHRIFKACFNVYRLQ